MASPQLENGYTPIAHELLLAIAGMNLSGRQLRVLLVIIDKTYGWKQKSAQLSSRQISALANMPFQHAAKAISDLLAMNIITEEYTTRRDRRLGINKDYETWGNCHRNSDSHQKGDRTVTDGGDRTVTETVTHTIISNKTKKQRAALFLELWELYPETHREGLRWISAETEAEVVENAAAVRAAMERYTTETQDKFICSARRFFEEKWRLYAPRETAQREDDDYQ